MIFGAGDSPSSLDPRFSDAAPPLRLVTPAAARDETLAALAERRAVLVRDATRVAFELCAHDGVVTAPRVHAEMRRRGLDDGTADARYLGAVLLPSKGWERTGELVGEGSKCRPVPVWKRATLDAKGAART